MFEEPEAKRVRRYELFGSDRSEESSSDEMMDVEMRARLNEQIAKSLGLAQVDISDQQVSKQAGISHKVSQGASERRSDRGDEESGDEFEFRLFSTSAPTTKVVLEDDDLGDGALVRARPESYYLVTSISPEQKLKYATAAVTGDQILERAKSRCWGLELPWRVVHATETGKHDHSTDTISNLDGERKGKGRPGKKKRVAMRTKSREAEEKAKLASARLAEKEEHIKDKKKRLNRAKKLRRRAKARGQKGDGVNEAGDSGDSDDSA